MSYNQGFGCYSYDSRRTNPVIDHSLIIDHHSLTEALKIDKFSSIKFSLLYQNVVFSSQVRKTSLNLTDEFFEIDDAVTKIIEYINENGGFTVIRWYKRGNIGDCTILHQINANDGNMKQTSTNDCNQVDNSKITYHPCVIKPTNSDFYDENHEHFKAIDKMKFDVSKLLYVS